jgi:hypothetical protein
MSLMYDMPYASPVHERPIFCSGTSVRPSSSLARPGAQFDTSEGDVIDTQAKEAKDAEQRFLECCDLILLECCDLIDILPPYCLAHVCCEPKERLQSSEATAF